MDFDLFPALEWDIITQSVSSKSCELAILKFKFELTITVDWGLLDC